MEKVYHEAGVLIFLHCMVLLHQTKPPLNMARIIIMWAFIASQVGCALGAIIMQVTQTYQDESTRGLSVSMFLCTMLFGIVNALLSFRIWKPVRHRLTFISLTDSEKDAKSGSIVYGLGALGYFVVLIACILKRVFVEHISVFTNQDMVTFGLLGSFILVTWFVMKSDGTKEPFSNAYVSGSVAFMAVFIPQVGSGIHFLRIGTDGVSAAALWLSLVMVMSKIAYYFFVRWQSEDKYKKSKASGVLIAESGNLISWLFVMWAFYHTLQ